MERHEVSTNVYSSKWSGVRIRFSVSIFIVSEIILVSILVIPSLLIISW